MMLLLLLLFACTRYFVKRSVFARTNGQKFPITTEIRLEQNRNFEFLLLLHIPTKVDCGTYDGAIRTPPRRNQATVALMSFDTAIATFVRSFCYFGKEEVCSE